jgi:hypothetical protein
MRLFIGIFALIIIGVYSYASNIHVLGKDSLGNSITVWCSQGENTSVIRAATQSPQKGWSLPTILSDVNTTASNPMIATNDLGSVVLWVGHNPTMQTNLLYASILPLKGTWSPPLQVSKTGEMVTNNYQISMDEKGVITVTWIAYNPEADDFILEAVTATLQGGFTEPQPLFVVN